ncbi:hypothetical protein J2S21_001380 [Peribacillus cavernae]|nr:hypothetical protein [Peribacillus cavernae]
MATSKKDSQKTVFNAKAEFGQSHVLMPAMKPNCSAVPFIDRLTKCGLKDLSPRSLKICG